MFDKYNASREVEKQLTDHNSKETTGPFSPLGTRP